MSVPVEHGGGDSDGASGAGHADARPAFDATALIHHPYVAPGGFDAPTLGVHKASTIFFDSVASMRSRRWQDRAGYTYGLHGTPTTFALEARLATLEGGSRCVLAPSGLAAITMVNAALLSSGDEVLLPANVYNPSKEQARRLLARWGVAHRLYDPLDAASLDAAIGPSTRLVWIEAPGSITMEFPDLAGLVAVARRRGVVSALDNTWGTGIAFRPFDVGGGVDLSMNALTKYPSGGGDVLMGSVVSRDAALAAKLDDAHALLGLGVAGNDAELVLRSLPSIALRYAAADRAARELASWLSRQPHVARVLHPALEGSPGHDHWRATCTGAAGLFSIVLDEALPAERVDAFVDALGLFRIGYSWGGPVSLVVPYDLRALRGPSATLRGHVVRFSIGLESVDALRADLAQALARLGVAGG